MCKNQLEVSICKLVDLEIEVIKTAIAAHFCEAVGSLAIACAISTPTIEDHLADDLVFHTFDVHHQTLFRHSEILEAQEFFTLFKMPLYIRPPSTHMLLSCLLYTHDAADEDDPLNPHHTQYTQHNTPSCL